MWFMFVVPFIVFIVIFLSIAINMFFGHRNTGDTMRDMVNTISAYAEQKTQETFKEVKEDKTCEYCGAIIKKNSNKCDSCGAKVKK